MTGMILALARRTPRAGHYDRFLERDPSREEFSRETNPSRWALRQVALPPHHSVVLAAGSRAVTTIRMASPVAMPSRGDRPSFLAGFFVRARRGFFASIQLSHAFRITRAAFSS